MKPHRILADHIFVNPEDQYRPDSEKLAIILLQQANSTLTGKAKYREVPAPISKWNKVEQFLLDEIPCTYDPKDQAILRGALEYIRDLCAESNYSGSFAASTQSKHTVENNNRKFRNWGEHIQFTPKDETHRREIPKKTPHRDSMSMDDEMRDILGIPKTPKGMKPLPRKEAPDPIEFKPYDSLSDTRIILGDKSRHDSR